MATNIVPITEADGWTLIVPSAATWCLVSIVSQGVVEVATTAADGTTPTEDTGHPFKYGEHVTRIVLPSGAIWMRVAPGWMYGTGAVTLAVDYE